ncbi:uncharacterized protein [Halyomorpha halys]|uniref:uncharacterized protein n=1 Tax=Halyomorpha halys TaxID=286706 RepID=UPI0006D4E738|nr:uncharacterized protein LOC106689069 [Halyomorpha halys]
MIRSVRREDGWLEYLVLPEHRRRRRHRVACVLVASLLLGCILVAAAVILPIALSTSLVALPAKLAVAKGLQGVRYFAILPVRQAKSEFRIQVAKPAGSSHVYDWAIENRLSILGGSVLLFAVIMAFFLRSRCRNRFDEDRTWDLQGALLSEQDED